MNSTKVYFFNTIKKGLQASVNEPKRNYTDNADDLIYDVLHSRENFTLEIEPTELLTVLNSAEFKTDCALFEHCLNVDVKNAVDSLNRLCVAAINNRVK